MKVVSFATIKDKVGRTTLTYNFGEWLAKKGHKVLLIDADPYCSLSQTYNVYQNTKTLTDIFEINRENQDKNPNDLIRHEHKNLDLLPSSKSLSQINIDLQTQYNKELIMKIWIRNNYEVLKKYDYILIDCSPDFSIVTINMIVASDVVFSPLKPNEYSDDVKALVISKFNHLQKTLVDPLDQHHSYVAAKLFFIGNRVGQNKQASENFLKQMETESDILTYFPEKELLNKSTLFHQPLSSLIDKKTIYRQNETFFKHFEQSFLSMLSIIK